MYFFATPAHSSATATGLLEPPDTREPNIVLHALSPQRHALCPVCSLGVMPQVRYVDDGSSSGTPADSDSDAATSPESDSGSEFGSDGEDGSPMARKRPAKVAPKRRVGHLTVRRALACLSVAGARARLLLVTPW